MVSWGAITPAKGLEFSLFASNFNHLADVSFTSSSWEAWTRRPEFEVVAREILSYINMICENPRDLWWRGLVPRARRGATATLVRAVARFGGTHWRVFPALAACRT